MKLKDCMLVTAAIALLGSASCKNAGYNKDKEDTTTYETKSDNTGYTVEVPATVKTNFETNYKGATNVTWRRYNPNDDVPIEWEWSGWPDLDTSYYTGRFNWDGRDYWVWYDDEGMEVGRITNISDFSTLPSGISASINTNYPGYTITSATMENDKNRNAYEIHLTKGEDKVKVLVDENGKVMKKKAVTAGMDTKEKPIKDSM